MDRIWKSRKRKRIHGMGEKYSASQDRNMLEI